MHRLSRETPIAGQTELGATPKRNLG